MSPYRVRGPLVLLVAVALLTGCAATIEGDPVAVPGGSPPSTSVTPRGEPAPPPTRQGSTALVNRTAGLAYDVPPDWAGLSGELNPFAFSGLGSVSPYDCDGRSYNRGVVGSTVAPRGDVAQTAATVAQQLGVVLYSTADSPPQIQASPPRPVQQAGRSGVVLDATISSSSNPCLATLGKLTVLVLDSTAELGLLQVFVGNVDLEGGPAQPANRTEQELAQIVGTVRQVS